jgi:uncharacterized SAM-binding protein YcdF (DUF218 family)
VPWGRGPRYRVERALDVISGVAARLRLTALAPWLARPLLVAEDVRPRPFIVVLCGGCRFSGQLSEATTARVEHGVRLFHRGLAPRLVLSGGRWAPHRPACAPRMKALALSLGMRDADLVVEDRSSRTAENAREVARLMAGYGASSILLVTSPVHMRRAKLCFERQGVEVSCAPTPGRLREALMAKEVLHEYLGLAYYRAVGWI